MDRSIKMPHNERNKAGQRTPTTANKNPAQITTMSTIMQKKLAHNIVKNTKSKKPLNKLQLAVSSGYAVNHANSHPEVIFEAKGVKKELAILGFDEESAKRVVSEIMNDTTVEPTDRLKASDQVFKVHGTYAPEKRISATVDINELQKTVQEQIAAFRQLKQ